MNAPEPNRAPDRRIDALVVVTAIALFARTVGFGFTDWDDLDFIVRNPLVTEPLSMGWRALLTTPWLGYPQTVPVLSWHLDTLIGGGAAWAFHATNVALHAGVAWLVLTIARSYGLGRVGSAAAALLFAVHPLVVEPVSWATGRKDLLAAAALLAAFAVHRRAARSGRDLTIGELLAVLAAAVFGLGSKPLLVVLPVLMGVDLGLARRRPERWQLVAMAATALAGLGVVALSMAQQSEAGALRTLGAGERVLFAIQHAGLQLEHTIVPLNLLPKYLDPLPQPVTSAASLQAFGLCLALGAIAVFGWRRGVVPVTLGVLWWCIAFAPSSGLVPLHRGPADVYSYVPLVGLALAAGAALDRIEARRLVATTLAVLTVGLGTLSYVQSAIWERPVTLWSPLVDTWPDDHRAWWALADAWRAEGRVGQAVVVYETAFDRLGWPEDATLPWTLVSGCHAAGDIPCAHRMIEAIGHRYPHDARFALRYVGFVDHDLGGIGEATFDRVLYPEAEQRAREALVTLSGDLDALETFAAAHIDGDPMWIPAAQRFSTEIPTRPAAAALLERAGLPVPPPPGRRP